MKRSALLFAGLALGAAGAAEAQLTTQMSNGWNFTFSGNINAFVTHEFFDDDGTTFTPGGIVPAGPNFNQTRIRTGFLPAYAVFDAKGKEGNTDLGVHFGFAPQINCASGEHDCLAQIDMRQVYLTVGGTWGQILAGREFGLFGRHNVLTDQTLFGVGATGASGITGSDAGATLGRSGFGYVYPNFNAQITYSTPAGRPMQLSVGLFEASSNGDYDQIQLPRVEAEMTWTQNSTMFWFGGLVQSTKNSPVTPDDNVSATAWGTSGGLRLRGAQLSVTGSGYYGQGLGTTMLTSSAVCGIGTCGENGSDDLRPSYGFVGQLAFTPTNSKMTVAGSYGSSFLTESQTEEGALTPVTFTTENTLISGGVYYQATPSLKVIGELNYAMTKGDVGETNKSVTPAFGLMLFY